MNTTVSFEIAELLQEKRIVIYSDYRYTDFKGIIRLERDASAVFPFAPTIADVVMWLYEKHGVWVNVDSDCYGVNWYSHILPCSKQVYDDLELRNKVYKSRFFIDASKTPTEAYSKSIEYCLTELI